jgi:hypothetical protein
LCVVGDGGSCDGDKDLLLRIVARLSRRFRV